MQTITLQLETGPLVVDLYGPDGAADVPTILLIHGWGGSGRYWREMIDRIGVQFRFIVPDLPGVGRSMPVRHPHTIFDQATTMHTLLAHLQVERTHVVGHSMGGAVAMVLAARHPHLVERLVLTSISLFRNDAERAFFSTFAEVAGVVMRFRGAWMADVPFLTQQMATRYFHHVPDNPQLLREAFLDYLEMDHGTAVACARSASDPAINAAARQIQAPTLLVATREDQVMSVANVDDTARTIPNCQLHWIEQCGHLPMVEKPDEYAALIRAFLSEPVYAVGAP